MKKEKKKRNILKKEIKEMRMKKEGKLMKKKFREEKKEKC